MKKTKKINKYILRTLIVLMAVSVVNPVSARLRKKLKEMQERAERVVGRQLDKLEEKASNADINIKKDKETEQDAGQNFPSGFPDSDDYGQVFDEGMSGFDDRSFEAYSKFDFVPGSRVVMYDDLSTSHPGDLPRGWNTGSNLETVTLSHLPGQWIRMGKGEASHVPSILEIPVDFTLEFDLVLDYKADKWAHVRDFSVLFSDLGNPDKDISRRDAGTNRFTFVFAGASSDGVQYHKAGKDASFNDRVYTKHPYGAKTSTKRGEIIKVSIWKTGQRIRVYLDESKVMDVPRALMPNVSVRTIRFHSKLTENNEYFYISNVRLAEDEPSQMEEQLNMTGVYSSQGIYFTSGSAEVSPESYPTLKRIADFIKSTGNTMLVAGHTDNVGDREQNRNLSARRAGAVRQLLVSHFGVDSNQLASIGYGDRYPIGNNDSMEGRRQNRRVDFVNHAVLGGEQYREHLDVNMNR